MFSFSVSATHTNIGYDFRNETLSDSTEFSDISLLQDDILDSLYTNSSDSASSTKNNIKIDFSEATKVFVYTPQQFLSLLDSNVIVDSILQNPNYCWKIPVSIRTDGIDYAVAYMNPSGNWTYYTASTTELGKKEVQYIIDPDNIKNTLSQNKIDNIQHLYALTISDLAMDLLIIDTGTETFLIPYASRPEFLNLENGKAYSITDMYEILDTYLSQQTSLSNQPSGGGSGNPETHFKLSTYVTVGLLFISFFYGIRLLQKRTSNK